MSPSSGIKGVYTNALLHLGPNVGKPVRRYRFALLLIVAAQLTFVRPRYYKRSKGADFFQVGLLDLEADPFAEPQKSLSPQRGEIGRRSILHRRISWSELSLPYHWRRSLMTSSSKILCGPMWSLSTRGLIRLSSSLWLLW